MIVLDYPCKWHFFHGWIIFHSMHIWLLYSFICPCTFWLLPYLSYCKCCSSACLCVCVCCCCSVATSFLQNWDRPHKTLSPLLPPSASGTHHSAFCEYGADCSRGLYEWTQTSFVLSFLVYVTEHNALGFIRAVDCVRTAFLSGWTTFIVWMDHGLLVRSSVEGPREYLHSSLTSCNICGITSESPMMIQKSLTTSYFINFFILKPIKAQKKGRMHVSFTCV